MLCRIAHILRKTFNWHRVDRRTCLGEKTEVSNSDQLSSAGWTMMMLETSISSLSFRSSELSQPSEVISS